MVLTMSTEDLSCSTKSIKNSFLVSRFSFLVLGTRQFWRGSRSYVDTISTAVAHERENEKRETRNGFLSFPNRCVQLRRQLRFFQIQIVALHWNNHFKRVWR